MRLYILKGKTPIEIGNDDFYTFSNYKRKLVHTERRNSVVSTVFLGTNYSSTPDTPEFFETMVFTGGKSYDLSCERYAYYDDAISGHIRMCTWVFGKYSEEDLFVDLL